MSEAQLAEVSSASHLRNMARIKRDEEELESLRKLARGEQDETEEETSDSEPSSERVTDTEVQNESVPKQKAKTETDNQTQEDDSGLSAEEKTFKQRYGDLRRHMQEKEKETLAKIEKQKNAPLN